MSSNQKFNQLQQRLSSKITTDNEEYLYFGGTAYLGIPQNKEITKLYIAGLEIFGLNNGTSRGNNVQLGIYNDAEQFIAGKYGAEAALITSSGYLAAQLTVSTYAKSGVVRYAPNTHPALWQNENPSVAAAFTTWSTNVVDEINSSNEDNWVLISNSLNNLVPLIYNFSFVHQINPSKKVVLIIDDSHGIGLLNNGSSVYSNLPQAANIEIVVVASMAKALGIDAGVVLGAEKSIANLKQSDIFYGASPPAAAGLYAFINAEQIYQSAYNKLQENVKLFTQNLPNKNDWHFVADFPVFLSKQPAIEQRLLEQKILISSFPYPDRNGKNLNRIVLSSWHSDNDILKLVAALG
jgi:7-keto-8-aminopelargonate synthetase-like enzyme